VEALHEEIRRSFPALERDLGGGRRIYLNSGGGTLVAERSVREMARAAQYANAQDGELTAGERLTAELQARARADVADFLNAPSAGEISFHLSTTHALFNLAVALRDRLRPGHNLVVTQLDHAANVSPWESLWGEDRGLEIRQCGMRPDGTLDLDHLRRLVDARTRVVAITHASNALGTVVPVREVVRIAHGHGRPSPPAKATADWKGALVVVDAVHHAYHGPLDVQELGCDFLAFSGYKLFGPMLGALWGRREWLDALRPYRVEPNLDESPTKYEQGTPHNAALAGLSGALGYLQWLGERVEEMARGRGVEKALLARLEGYPDGPRRRLKWAMAATREYERRLSAAVLEGFRSPALRGVRLHGIADPARLDERDPTFLFEAPGKDPESIRKRLWEESGIEIPRGSNFSLVVTRVLKSRRTLRASFAHYDGAQTVQRFLETLERALT
jgi:cysteine desulfurase family protein (TIGR01976 family)